MSPAVRLLTGPTAMSALGLMLVIAMAGPGRLVSLFTSLDPSLIFAALAIHFIAWFGECERFRATMARLGAAIGFRETFLAMSAGLFSVSSRASGKGAAYFSRCHFLKAFPVIITRPVNNDSRKSAEIKKRDAAPIVTHGGLSNPRLCHAYIFSVILEVQAAAAGSLLFILAGALLTAEGLGIGILSIADRSASFVRGILGTPAGDLLMILILCAAGIATAFFISATTFVTAFNRVIPPGMEKATGADTKMFLPCLTKLGWPGLFSFGILSGAIGLLVLYSQALTAAALGIRTGAAGFVLVVLSDRICSAWNFTRWGLGTRELALGIGLPLVSGCDASAGVALGLALALPKAMSLLVSATAFFKVKTNKLKAATARLSKLNSPAHEMASKGGSNCITSEAVPSQCPDR